jgi:hypothetical protein
MNCNLRTEDFAIRNNHNEGELGAEDVLAESSRKVVRYGNYLNGEALVCKINMSQMGNRELDLTVAVAESALKYLPAFHAEIDQCFPIVGDNLHIQLALPSVWSKQGTLGRVQKFLVQPYIEEELEKFNNNTGWANEEAEMAQALSHFSFHHSEGTRLLSDLQGLWDWEGDHRYILTGVSMMTNGAAGTLGPRDLGAEGIENFFHHHVCNAFCSPTWMKMGNAEKFFEAEECSLATGYSGFSSQWGGSSQLHSQSSWGSSIGSRSGLSSLQSRAGRSGLSSLQSRAGASNRKTRTGRKTGNFLGAAPSYLESAQPTTKGRKSGFNRKSRYNNSAVSGSAWDSGYSNLQSRPAKTRWCH